MTLADLAAQLAGAPDLPGASCATADPEAFFPDNGGSLTTAAMRTCAACPVLEPCRAYGIAHPTEHGYWGGMGQRTRERIERQQRREAAA